MNQDLKNIPFLIKNYKALIFFVSIALLCTSVYSQNSSISNTKKQVSIVLTKYGKQIKIESYIPEGITEFELRIDSDRNNPVSSAREIASTDPNLSERASIYLSDSLDIRYPVVDMELELGMDGICVFEKEPKGNFIFGEPFFRESLPLSKEIILPSHKLEYWENSLMLNHSTPRIERGYLRKTFLVVLRNFNHTINLLSADWSGKISIAIYKDEKYFEHHLTNALNWLLYGVFVLFNDINNFVFNNLFYKKQNK